MGTALVNSPDTDPRELFDMILANASALQSMFFGKPSQTQPSDSMQLASMIVPTIWSYIQAQLTCVMCPDSVSLIINPGSLPTIQIVDHNVGSISIDLSVLYEHTDAFALNRYRQLEAVWNEHASDDSFVGAVRHGLSKRLSSFFSVDIQVMQF